MSIASLSRKSFADARSLREPLKHERFVRPFLRAFRRGRKMGRRMIGACAFAGEGESARLHRGRGHDGAVSGHREAKTWDVKAF